jgi:hypothetical protein
MGRMLIRQSGNSNCYRKNGIIGSLPSVVEGWLANF